jgi:Viral coat protein P2 N-terminal domain
MLLVKNVPFTNVVGTGTATVNLPVGMSYNKIILALGGTTFTKSMITGIRVKLNGKIIVVRKARSPRRSLHLRRVAANYSDSQD